MIAKHLFVLSLAAVPCLAACSSDPAHVESRGTGGASGQPNARDAGNGLLEFTPPNMSGGGSVLFTASGEVLALTGYPFPPAQEGDVAFVDGWEVRFHHLLVTLDKLRLSENP